MLTATAPLYLASVLTLIGTFTINVCVPPLRLSTAYPALFACTLCLAPPSSEYVMVEEATQVGTRTPNLKACCDVMLYDRVEEKGYVVMAEMVTALEEVSVVETVVGERRTWYMVLESGESI
jgi:hypothetical protein